MNRNLQKNSIFSSINITLFITLLVLITFKIVIIIYLFVIHKIAILFLLIFSLSILSLCIYGPIFFLFFNSNIFFYYYFNYFCFFLISLRIFRIRNRNRSPIKCYHFVRLSIIIVRWKLFIFIGVI